MKTTLCSRLTMSFGLKRTSITISKLYYLPPHKRFFTNISNYGERHKLPSSPKATNLILMPSSLPPYLIHSSPIPTCFSNILLCSNCIIRYNLTSLPSVLHNAQIKNLSSLALTFFSLSLEDESVPHAESIGPYNSSSASQVACTGCSLIWNTRLLNYLLLLQVCVLFLGEAFYP